MSALDRHTFHELVDRVDSARSPGMRSSFEAFEKLGMPSPSQEAWRYVDVDFDLHGMAFADGRAEALAADPFLAAFGTATATIVDGAVRHAAFPAARLGEEGLVAALERVSADLDVFSAARGAFAADGLGVHIPPGTDLADPIVIDISAVDPGAGFPVVSITAGANSEASVVVVFRSPAGVDAVMSPLVVVDVGDGARLRYQAVQALGSATAGVIHQRVSVGKDATALLGEVGLGGRLGRLDLAVSLDGAGASVDVAGLYFGEAEQVLDYRLVIDHIGRSTTSNVFLKGAVEDSAQSVFTGLLRIGRDAARSSAFETNRNLVLSKGAKAHSVPNLEILCDDVVCGHGSSVGPLEDEHLYYLESRGLGRERAERLLIRGFFQEVIDRLPVRGLEEPVGVAVFRRFADAQLAGRVG